MVLGGTQHSRPNMGDPAGGRESSRTPNPCVHLSVNLSKAYDSVYHTVLVAILRSNVVPHQLVDIIQELYTRQDATRKEQMVYRKTSR